jgi:hypothetical protein
MLMGRKFRLMSNCTGYQGQSEASGIAAKASRIEA